MTKLLKLFGFSKSNYMGKGSYRFNYRDEACMKFTDYDAAILAARQ